MAAQRHIHRVRRPTLTASRDVISVESIMKISTSHLGLLDLSSPNPMKPYEHRNPLAQMKQCLEGKPFLRTYVPLSVTSATDVPITLTRRINILSCPLRRLTDSLGSALCCWTRKVTAEYLDRSTVHGSFVHASLMTPVAYLISSQRRIRRGPRPCPRVRRLRRSARAPA